MKTLFFVEKFVQQGLAFLTLRHPALKWLFSGWASFIPKLLFERTIMFFIEKTSLGASLILIEFETDKERDEFVDSVQAALDAKKSGKVLTQEEKDAFDKKVIDATRKFVRLRRVRGNQNTGHSSL